MFSGADEAFFRRRRDLFEQALTHLFSTFLSVIFFKLFPQIFPLFISLKTLINSDSDPTNDRRLSLPLLHSQERFSSQISGSNLTHPSLWNFQVELGFSPVDLVPIADPNKGHRMFPPLCHAPELLCVAQTSPLLSGSRHTFASAWQTFVKLGFSPMDLTINGDTYHDYPLALPISHSPEKVHAMQIFSQSSGGDQPRHPLPLNLGFSPVDLDFRLGPLSHKNPKSFSPSQLCNISRFKLTSSSSMTRLNQALFCLSVINGRRLHWRKVTPVPFWPLIYLVQNLALVVVRSLWFEYKSLRLYSLCSSICSSISDMFGLELMFNDEYHLSWSSDVSKHPSITKPIIWILFQLTCYASYRSDQILRHWMVKQPCLDFKTIVVRIFAGLLRSVVFLAPMDFKASILFSTSQRLSIMTETKQLSSEFLEDGLSTYQDLTCTKRLSCSWFTALLDL
ncbi:PREDICTED: uncharacterized protein LOC104755621 [Camelina sativa]|uniref:Uncharacterized protein LOC104755621 n=1 Tax=Camelina sativa TaxID=90675 RepID=A0ABM0WUG5_CAMSA|nr:PREDICTED: uncharacterized protein LOC104755621 [Camelina sativa]